MLFVHSLKYVLHLSSRFPVDTYDGKILDVLHPSYVQEPGIVKEILCLVLSY